jgi:Mn-containing catalase
MHQNQWLAAIKELKADGLEETPCPSNFPQAKEHTRFSYQFINCSAGTESEQGRWAHGQAPDGKGEFEYIATPQPQGGIPELDGGADPRFYGTPKKPMPATPKASSRPESLVLIYGEPALSESSPGAAVFTYAA